ncbi:hypothetical protein BDR04DRAFT_1118762 [Suillus decipiens]|nr:hypothetical protein BDR04DRAFT_1118762 [Suillus decipiens]
MSFESVKALECLWYRYAELVAYGRNTEEIAEAIGADLVVFQALPDLIASVRQFNPSISTFDRSAPTGEHVTGGVSEEYFYRWESLPADKVKNKVAVKVGLMYSTPG